MYGFTYRQMIAYTFLAGLVARIVRTGFEYEIMDDVKSGQVQQVPGAAAGLLSLPHQQLLRPEAARAGDDLGHPGAGPGRAEPFWGVSLELPRILAFLATLVLAVALNFLIFYCFSAVAFWIVEIGFLFEGIRIVTVLLSGGIFPLEVFGERFVQVTSLLPFKYTVNYPINVLNGKISPAGALAGAADAVPLDRGLPAARQPALAPGQRRYVAVGG